MSHSLKISKGSYIGGIVGEYCRGNEGDATTMSLDFCSYRDWV